MVMNPKWKIDAWGPEKNQLYKKLQQSKMESWIDQKNHDNVDTDARQSNDTSKRTQ